MFSLNLNNEIAPLAHPLRSLHTTILFLSSLIFFPLFLSFCFCDPQLNNTGPSETKNGIAGTESSLRPHRQWWPAKTLGQPFCSQVLLLLWFTQPSSSSQKPPPHFSTTPDFHARCFQTGLYLSRLRVFFFSFSRFQYNTEIYMG